MISSINIFGLKSFLSLFIEAYYRVLISATNTEEKITQLCIPGRNKTRGGSHKSAETYKAARSAPGQSNELITLVSRCSREMPLKWLNRPTIRGVMSRE